MLQDLLMSQVDIASSNSKRVFEEYQALSRIAQIKSALKDSVSSTEEISSNVRKIISEVCGRSQENKEALEKSFEEIKRETNEIEIEKPR